MTDHLMGTWVEIPTVTHQPLNHGARTSPTTVESRYYLRRRDIFLCLHRPQRHAKPYCSAATFFLHPPTHSSPGCHSPSPDRRQLAGSAARSSLAVSLAALRAPMSVEQIQAILERHPAQQGGGGPLTIHLDISSAITRSSLELLVTYS